MKKLIYVTIITMIGATLLTGCGAGKTVTNKATAKTVSNTPKALQANKNEVQNSVNSVKDLKGLSSDDLQDIGDADKVNAAVDPVVKGFIETLYNSTPDTVDSMLEKLKNYTFYDNGQALGEDTDRFRVNLKKLTNKLTDYSISNTDIGVDLTSKKDGSKLYGVIETLKVNYIQNDKKCADSVVLKLGYNAKGDKTFKVVNVNIQDAK